MTEWDWNEFSGGCAAESGGLAAGRNRGPAAPCPFRYLYNMSTDASAAGRPRVTPGEPAAEHLKPQYPTGVWLTGTQWPFFTTQRKDSFEPWCLVALKLMVGEPKMSCQSLMLSMPETKLSAVRSLPAFFSASTTSWAPV